MADSHHHHHHQQDPQPSGFWTLTRPSKLSKRRNSDLHELHHKVFNICVVGLSGVEKDRGPIGIGKSCLCNRFVRSAADDYFTDHISVLSQSDFSGRVVNNDHWLYWGSVIKSCDGYDLAFNVIEQTEFVDDACFQPFKSGKTEPYFKRCANTKLVSAEKLMYICKNQLGIEREYEQRYLPDGKFNVDGFLCLFDVSEVQGRSIDKQIEMTNLIMLNLIKTKKPIVFVTTKHDEASEILVAEAERLVNQPDFRGLVPIVETSAQENVNINIAFLVCAQMIDKTRTKLRIPPYYEAFKNHSDLLSTASDAYLNLIRSTVIDFRATWQQVCIKLSHNPEFLQYTYLHGLDRATMVFKTHLKRLHEECINQKVQHYLRLFPDILNELIPTDSAQNNHNNNMTEQRYVDSSPQAWESTKEQLRSHPLYNKFFISVPAGIAWHDTEILQSTDNRIPSDWLDSEHAFSIFQHRNHILETECKRKAAKTMFAQMLRESKIPVGQSFIELKPAFDVNPTLELLRDQELFEVYVDYQNNLLQQTRSDFQELLLENAEHLQHLTSSNKVIRQEDIKTINTILQHDERYQALDRFDQDRTLMMIRHLSFLHSQISEQCPSYPKCVEPEIERLLITKAKTLVSKFYESRQDGKSRNQPQKTCDLIILGPRRPSQQLILALNVLNSRAPKDSQYQITFTVFDNTEEVDSQLQRFKQTDTKPKGCFGVFTNRRSLDHVDYTLGKFLSLSSQTQNDKKNFGSPPVVMLYAADITLDERTMLALENEGQRVADRFKCPFMNVTAIDQYRQHQQNNILSNDQETATQVMSECASLDYACVDAAFNVLKEAISRRVCFMELYNNQELIPRQAFSPDARILMCLLCGEPFSNERFLWQMFLEYEDCYVTSSKSICLKVKLEDGQDKFIEVVITSYTHGALNHREELLHGFILVCSVQRKASLSILNAFSFNIPCTPILVVAIDGSISGSVSISKESLDERTSLVKEAQSVSTRLKGHFKLIDLEDDSSKTSQELGIQRIRGFLLSVIRRKPMIEKAYELGEVEFQESTQTFAQDSSNLDEPYLEQRSRPRAIQVDDNDNETSESPSEDSDSRPQPHIPAQFKKEDNQAKSNSRGEFFHCRKITSIFILEELSILTLLSPLYRNKVEDAYRAKCAKTFAPDTLCFRACSK